MFDGFEEALNETFGELEDHVTTKPSQMARHRRPEDVTGLRYCRRNEVRVGLEELPGPLNDLVALGILFADIIRRYAGWLCREVLRVKRRHYGY